MESTARRIRSVNITPIETTIRHGSDGVVYLSSPQALGPYPDRITDRLEHWAREAPGRVFLAQRDLTGGWRTLTYADAFDSVGRIAQALLDRKLSPDRPIVILSGNGIDHALLALAAMYVGVPYAPIAPAYSLQARDYGTLQHIFRAAQARPRVRGRRRRIRARAVAGAAGRRRARGLVIVAGNHRVDTLQ